MGTDTSGYGVANPYFERAAADASPSLAAYDTAAARIRSRVEGKQKANAMQIQDQFAGRGLSASGIHEGQQRQNREAGMGAYATGLADLEEDYNKSKQEGARILQGIGSDAGQLKNTGNYQAGQLLGNYSGIYGFLNDNDPDVGNFISGMAGGTDITLPTAGQFSSFAATGASGGGGTTPGAGGGDAGGGGVVPGDSAGGGSLPADGAPTGGGNAPGGGAQMGTPEYESQIERHLQTYRGLAKSQLDAIVAFYGYVPTWLTALKTKYNIPDRHWGRN